MLKVVHNFITILLNLFEYESSWAIEHGILILVIIYEYNIMSRFVWKCNNAVVYLFTFVIIIPYNNNNSRAEYN